MTTTSIAVAFTTALLCGLIAGFGFRKMPRGETWALGCAVALGLALLQMSTLSDLLRPLQPKVAMDWLPGMVLLAAACSVLRQDRYRWTLAIALALLLPIRLLWGSVYMQFESLSVPFVIAFGAWAASLAVAMGLPDDDKNRGLSWNAVGWALMYLCMSLSIMMSGSLTYGAASGICAVAALGVMLSARHIPNLAAVPLVCLIGLATSFSELSPWAALLMFLALISLLLAEKILKLRTRAALRIAASTAALLVSAVTFGQFRNDLGGDNAYGSEGSLGGYGNLPSINSSQNTPPATTPASNASTGWDDGTLREGDAIDPFGGLGLPEEIKP